MGNPSTRSVVITGMGIVTGLGCDLATYWDNLRHGRSGVGRIQRYDPSALPVQFAGEVWDWHATAGQFFDSKELKRLDRFSQFALYASDAAVRQSGIAWDGCDRLRCGVAIGSAIGGLEEIEEQHTRLLEGGARKVSPFLIPKILANAASGLVSIRYGLRGPTTTVATACASANQSIGDAFRMIRWGLADVMIAGGSEAAVVPLAISGFARMQALSTRSDEPQKASRPWDKQRDGFVMAEGAGSVVLEERSHALRRGAPILATLEGVGCSSDGHHITAPLEDGAGAAEAMRLALADAQLRPDEVDYINAHGTSTPLGDRAETMAIKAVFGDHARRLAVSSTKSQLGHLLGASGAAELVASVLALQNQVIPPTINLDQPDDGCDLDYVPHHARPQAIRTVLSNSFGFGGHNASLIVRAADA
jgi:3-oxoacyl-[acyl-carrier-protein] synthase II